MSVIDRNNTLESVTDAISPYIPLLEGDAIKIPLDVARVIMNMPSAEPKSEERMPESAQNTPNDELISKKAAIGVLHGYFDGMLDTDTVCPKVIYGLFECMPSAEPEIIRCKDCKNFRRWIDTDITFCDLTDGEVCEKDFCSRAERITYERNDL